MSRSRWDEYRNLLRIAVGQEYDIVGVECWLANEQSDDHTRPLSEIVP